MRAGDRNERGMTAVVAGVAEGNPLARVVSMVVKRHSKGQARGVRQGVSGGENGREGQRNIADLLWAKPIWIPRWEVSLRHMVSRLVKMCSTSAVARCYMHSQEQFESYMCKQHTAIMHM